MKKINCGGTLKKILIIVLTSFSLLYAQQNYKQVKIYIDELSNVSQLQKLGMQFDHYSFDRTGSIITFISDDDYEILKHSGYSYDVIIDDWFEHYNNRPKFTQDEKQQQLAQTAFRNGVTGFDYGSMGGFYTLEEVNLKLDEMYNDFPNLVSAKESIGMSYEGRDIYFIRISDNPNVDEDEPEVLYTALHHAREPEGMMQLIYFMFYLLENYGTDAEVTYLVDNRELYFIPVVNPDGYAYNESTNPNGGGFWRKNRRVNDDGSIGVDLNRNYGPFEYWDAPNGGSSTNGDDNTYRGESPFSEPETEAIRIFLYEHEISNCLNYHTYGNLLIYPYGALEVETPDSLIYRGLAVDMTQFNNYTYGTDQQTVGYSTRGNSDDYMYDGETDLKGKIITMTPELGGPGDGFWPPQNRIIPLAEENLFPNLYFAWAAGGVVTSSNIRLDREYVNPGAVVYVHCDFKNKGLGSIDDVTAACTSENQFVDIANPVHTVGTLDSQEKLSFENIFELHISDNAIIGENVEFEITTILNSLEMFTDRFEFRIGTPTEIFVDQSNSLDEYWTSTSNSQVKWELTTSHYYSRPSSFTDSPGNNYPSNVSTRLTLKEQIDLTGTHKPFLSFRTKFEIERGWDYGQVEISTNGGGSWIPIEGKYTEQGSVQFQPNQPVISGIQNNWVKEEMNLSAYENENILIRFLLRSDEYVEFDGWYIDDITVQHYPVTDVEENGKVPLEYALYQNYPNPFNPSTVINFSLKNAGFTTIEIYNQLGEKVQTVIKEHLPAGNHHAKFAPSPWMSSGVYFYRMISENEVFVKKMVFMK